MILKCMSLTTDELQIVEYFDPGRGGSSKNGKPHISIITRCQDGGGITVNLNSTQIKQMIDKLSIAVVGLAEAELNILLKGTKS